MRTIVLRIRITDDLTNENVMIKCKNIKNLIQISNIEYIVMLDFREISEQPSNQLIETTKDLVLNLYENNFTTIYLGGGAYPININVGHSRHKRWDRELWKMVSSELKIDMGYCDYTVVSPLWQETPMIRRGKATIRYALRSEWLVLKGNNSTKEESISLSILLLKLFKGDFYKEKYSFGDKLIADRANADLPLKERKGGGETHLLEGVNHHISLVIKEDYPT